MDDFVKHAPSYQLDQEILDERKNIDVGLDYLDDCDGGSAVLVFIKRGHICNSGGKIVCYDQKARGINMTVEEVAGLSTGKYSQRVQALNLSDNDLVFLKCLRRRIKNRVASQNSRRRSMEHLRRLARELRVVRACRRDALCERRALLSTSAELRTRCTALRSHIVQVLKERSDPTTVPDIDIKRIQESHAQNKIREPDPEAILTKNGIKDNLFECRIEKLVQQSVNHIFKDKTDKKMVSAKTVFIDTKKVAGVQSDVDIQRIEYDTQRLSDYQKLDFDKTKQLPEFSEPLTNLDGKLSFEEGGVLNLCVKERRRSHGRKQLAPKRITYVLTDNDDGVIDFSIKKENQ